MRTYFDVVVVGGGIHGVGVAQAAAAAGYSVLLLEQSRLAAGTSSCSSKLIHGGLRYLESGQFKLVRETLREREILLRIAPGLVRLATFLIPIYTYTRRRPWQICTGLSLYSVLSGLSANSRFHKLSADEWSQLSLLRRDKLQTVFSYFDGQTDDVLLTRAVAVSATSLGAVILHPASFQQAEQGKDGYTLRYLYQNALRHCQCRMLINAGGPWVNEIQNRIAPTHPITPVDLVQGTHLHYDQAISDAIFYVEAPQDQRAVFVMPWQGGMLIGTTETIYHGKPEQLQVLPQEVAYLQETLQFYFPQYTGKQIGSMAGLRVLPAGDRLPFHRSRETLLLTDSEHTPRCIAIYGGKLTSYRATAMQVMALARKTLPPASAIARTDELILTGTLSRESNTP